MYRHTSESIDVRAITSRRTLVTEFVFLGCSIGSGYLFKSSGYFMKFTSCSKSMMASTSPTIERHVVKKSKSRHLLNIWWYFFCAAKFSFLSAFVNCLPMHLVPNNDIPFCLLIILASNNLLLLKNFYNSNSLSFSSSY